MNIKVADNRRTKVLGAVISEVSGMNPRTREKRSSKQILYVVEGVKGLYLSKQCARDLGLISQQFPCIADEKTGRHEGGSKWVESSVAGMSNNKDLFNSEDPVQVNNMTDDLVKSENIDDNSAKVEVAAADSTLESGQRIAAECEILADGNSGEPVQTCSKMRKELFVLWSLLSLWVPNSLIAPRCAVHEKLPFEPTEENVPKLE